MRWEADQQARKQLAAVDQFWMTIASTIEDLALDYTHLKIYQDVLQNV